MESILTKNQILSEVTKSTHRDYGSYVTVTSIAAKTEPEFLAHLIAWNRDHGSIRDSKIALPMISLSVPDFKDDEFVNNSLSHLALLDPRNFVKALRFGKQLKSPGHSNQLRKLVERYLRYREEDIPGRWTQSAIRYREDMTSLYGMYHIKPHPVADRVLLKKSQYHLAPRIFQEIASLRTSPPEVAANIIRKNRLPFLVIKSNLKSEQMKNADVLSAMIDVMSPTEIVTNMKFLERLGYKTAPAARGSLDKALSRVSSSSANLLKTSVAIEAIEDETMKERLRDVQEKQITRTSTIEGDWLVLGDKSGSMSACIDVARNVAATLAKMVSGRVHLVFFDTAPRYYNATGKSYEEIKEITRRIAAGGGTSIGCGLRTIMEDGINVDGIAVVSDGHENEPPKFSAGYAALKQMLSKEPPVYFYRVGTSGGTTTFEASMKAEGFDLQVFRIEGSDYYSIPNIAKTMTTKRYGLIDSVLDTPLITLDQVFGGKFERAKRRKQNA